MIIEIVMVQSQETMDFYSQQGEWNMMEAYVT